MKLAEKRKEIEKENPKEASPLKVYFLQWFFFNFKILIVKEKTVN